MKKLILIFIVLSFFSVCFAGSIQDMHMGVLARKNTSVTCDDCSGTLKFAWHMEDDDSTPDVTIGNPCGCSDGDSIGAITNSPSFSTTQKSDGSYSLLIDALTEDFEFDVSAYDLIDMRDVKITFDIWVISFPSGVPAQMGFFKYEDNTGDILSMYIQNSSGSVNRILVAHEASGATKYVASGALNTGQWYSCEYQADYAQVGNDHYMYCGVSADENDDDFTDDTDGTGTMYFGDLDGGETESYYLDNFKITTADRWD